MSTGPRWRTPSAAGSRCSAPRLSFSFSPAENLEKPFAAVGNLEKPFRRCSVHFVHDGAQIVHDVCFRARSARYAKHGRSVGQNTLKVFRGYLKRRSNGSTVFRGASPAPTPTRKPRHAHLSARQAQGDRIGTRTDGATVTADVDGHGRQQAFVPKTCKPVAQGKPHWESEAVTQ